MKLTREEQKTLLREYFDQVGILGHHTVDGETYGPRPVVHYGKALSELDELRDRIERILEDMEVRHGLVGKPGARWSSCSSGQT